MFSFIEDPDSALETLGDFVSACVSGARHITIDQRETADLDLCAASVLNALALEAKGSLRVSFAGAYPQKAEAQDIVRATGLPRALGVPLPEQPGFYSFPLARGGRSADVVDSSSAKERRTGELAHYVNEWLRQHGYEFTTEGKGRLARLVGEVLANAEDHSGRRTWWIAGYMRRAKGVSIGDCHVTIFNLGFTLAESLKKMPLNSPVRAEIEQLIQTHTARKFFVKGQWTDEGLWTLYALQEGVTRFGEPGRGIGTAEMIEMFQVLGNTKTAAVRPKMCLVSGHTYVLFDGRFRMRLERTADGGHRRLIAFNSSNDLAIPPEKGYVRTLKRFFPGTLISLRFYMDAQYLRELQRRASA